jgi:hypothetical protein
MIQRDMTIFPLAYGTNKPLGNSKSEPDRYGHRYYANGSRIYGVVDATSYLRTVAQMFHARECDEASAYNMGVSCKNFTALDFDDFWSKNTQNYVKELRRIIGDFDEAAVVLTPGGYHEEGGHGPGVHLIVKKFTGIKSGHIIPSALDIKNDSHSYICGAGSVRPRGV